MAVSLLTAAARDQASKPLQIWVHMAPSPASLIASFSPQCTPDPLPTVLSYSQISQHLSQGSRQNGKKQLNFYIVCSRKH